MSRTLKPVATVWRPLGILLAGLCLWWPGTAGVATASEWSIAVEEVRARGGVTAWLVASHGQPVVAVRFAFAGGSAQEPPDKRGISSLLAEALGDGAGGNPPDQLRRRLAALSASVSFSASRDAISGALDAPSAGIEQAAALVGAAIASARFQPEAVARLASRGATRLAELAGDPAVRAEDAWFRAAFGDHHYAMSPAGTAETLASITAADLGRHRSRTMTRDRLHVAVAGDLDARRLERILDLMFGALPERGAFVDDPAPRLTAPARAVTILRDATTSSVVFGLPAPGRRDPGYMPALVLNEIVGGGATASRFGQALRVRSSLVYDVDSRLISDNRSSYLIGQLAAASADAERAVSVVREELRRIVRDGVTEAEVENAKSYLTGSFPLSFDSSPKIAGNLLAIAQSGLGRDYPELRRRAIERVSRDDVNRVAAEYFRPELLIVSVARGEP